MQISVAAGVMSGKGWARVIGLLSAVPEEGRHLIIHLKAKFAIAGKTLYRGRRCGKEIIYIISGIGKANAAHAATLLLERFSPALVILFGIGGAYPAAGLAVGDIAVAKKVFTFQKGKFTESGFEHESEGCKLDGKIIQKIVEKKKDIAETNAATKVIRETGYPGAYPLR